MFRTSHAYLLMKGQSGLSATDQQVQEVSQRYFQLYGLYLKNYSAVQKVFSIIDQCIQNNTLEQYGQSICNTVVAFRTKCNEDDEMTIEIFDQIEEAFKTTATTKQQLTLLCKKYQQSKKTIQSNLKLMQMLFQTYFITDRVSRPVFDPNILKKKLVPLQNLYDTAKKVSQCLVKNYDEFGSECAQFVEETVQQIISRVNAMIEKQENKMETIKQNIKQAQADVDKKQKQLQSANKTEQSQLKFQIKQSLNNIKLLSKELEFQQKLIQGKKK